MPKLKQKRICAFCDNPSRFFIGWNYPGGEGKGYVCYEHCLIIEPFNIKGLPIPLSVKHNKSVEAK